MVKAMYSGVAGLKAHQSKMDVIGNNIANVNTWGYKAMDTSFKESIYSTVNSASSGSTADGGYGGTNPSLIGYGSMVSAITSNFTSGNQVPTGKKNDLYIDGTAFFAVGPMYGEGDAKSPSDIFLSRVGDFGNVNGYLVDSNGRYVYGSTMATGGLVQSPEGISTTTKGPVNDFDHLPKSEVKFKSKAGTYTEYTKDAAVGKMNKNIFKTADGESSLPVNGTNIPTGHPLYTHLRTAGWKGDMIADPSNPGTMIEQLPPANPPTHDVVKEAVAAYNKAQAKALSDTGVAAPKGTHRYAVDPDDLGNIIKLEWNSSSAEAIPVPSVDVSTDKVTGVTTTISYTATSAPGKFTQTIIVVTPPSDDAESTGPQFDDGRLVFDPATGGYKMSENVETLKPIKIPTSCTYYENGVLMTEDNIEFSTFSIEQDGMIYGTSSVSKRAYLVGCVGLVNVSNPSGMNKSDGPYYQLSASSGAGSIIQPGGVIGRLTSGYLESANVDIATEFSTMITTQRGFQANSKIITVTDEMLQELVNMKR